MDFKEFYREFEDEVKENLSAALWDKARVKADPEGFAKELFDSDIGFTAEEAAEEFVDMINVMKDQGELNEARPRPFRPGPDNRRAGGKWVDVDVGAADAARYKGLQARAQEFNKDPRGYVEGKWRTTYADMMNRLVAQRDGMKNVEASRTGDHYFNGPSKKPTDEIYSLVLEFSWDGLPNHLRRNLVNIVDKLAAKEGLFVNNSVGVCMQLGYEGDLPHTSREGDALATDLAKRTVNIVDKLHGILNAEKDRKFGKTSEALDDSIIDEIASAAAGLPKGDWRSYEKVKKVILPKYRDTLPVDVLSDAIAAAVGL